MVSLSTAAKFYDAGNCFFSHHVFILLRYCKVVNKIESEVNLSFGVLVIDNTRLNKAIICGGVGYFPFVIKSIQTIFEFRD